VGNEAPGFSTSCLTFVRGDAVDKHTIARPNRPSMQFDRGDKLNLPEGWVMSYRETEHLRVLIANERKDRLALVAPIVAGLGHEVIAREIEVEDVGPVTARERPDVALVGLGESSAHALGLIEKIVREAACPVIALIHAPDSAFVKEASKRGIFAYITDSDAKDWQSSIDIVLRRFAEFHDLEGAFGRRAIAERAKGILMERHSVDESTAFDMLRRHSRSTNRKLVDVASAVVDGHGLLPKQPMKPPSTAATS
jgi:response regulator NasT